MEAPVSNQNPFTAALITLIGALLILFAYLSFLVYAARGKHVEAMGNIQVAYRTLVYQDIQVAVRNEGGVKNVNGHTLRYGEICTLGFGSELEVVGREGSNLLLRSLSEGKTRGKQCPTGTLFFKEDQWFYESWRDYQTVLALLQEDERKREAVRGLLSEEKKLSEDLLKKAGPQ
jgi:hypothetical protein